MKPSLRGLFQSIKGLLEATDMMWKQRMNETRRLSHIDFLMKKVMYKSVFNIKLTNGPVIRNNNGYN